MRLQKGNNRLASEHFTLLDDITLAVQRQMPGL